ncbi:MAG: protein translocase subunit SecD [Verrucomicrobiae bacterium]|nr:protein translocase subunit SecD [Verrucomicrobiae bacterium]
MVKSIFWRSMVTLAVLGLTFYYLYPPFDIKKDGRVVTPGKLKLGLDLRGGTSFLVEVDLSGKETSQKSSALDQALKILHNRIDPSGVREPIIQKMGETRINIQIPGATEEQVAADKAKIEKVAKLEFRMVHPRNAEMLEMISQGEPAPIGYEVIYGRENIAKKGEPASFVKRPYLVKIRPELGGSYVKRAMRSFDQVGGAAVSITLNDEGAEIFGKVTEKHVNELMAIVLDGEVKSAPVIRGAIYGGRCEISGSMSPTEAEELASVLENPLETPVRIVEVRSVGPSLAEDSIKRSINASVGATLAIVVFMLLYYSVAGLIADIALVMNLFILLALMVCFNASLTLPGVAGIVLVLGMAVDANVLIYERIREEIAQGKSFRNAVVAGYSRAFLTIIDSHVTTLLTAAILILFGTGAVKGFGVTLTMGLVVSLFTALFVTRIIFDFLIYKGWLQNVKMLHVIGETKIDFLAARNFMMVISAVLIAAGFYWGAQRGPDIWGIDFRGGDTLVMKVRERVSLDAVSDVLKTAGLKEFTPQYQTASLDSQEFLQVNTDFNQGGIAQAALQKAFPKAGFELFQLDKVGPAVGQEILWTALLSTILGLVGILLYVSLRFEFPFAVGAVVGVAHDVAITLAIYMMCGGQFSAPIVAAVLTIIGFSINDTIVIFDRIRENLRLHPGLELEKLMNLSVNQTLGRTILTSGTAFLATASLYVFGAGVLKDFAFCFGIGVVVGTFSSVYICAPIVLWWSKWRRHDLRSLVRG